MDQTPEAILAFAAKRAREAWEKDQQPYLLARLSPELAEEGMDYKSVLGGQRLKDFFGGAAEQVKVVRHPSQKSKVGLIPADKDFAYVEAAAPADRKAPPRTVTPERFNGSRRRNVVAHFLQLVSELDEADAAQVQIPTHILTKLMRDR